MTDQPGTRPVPCPNAQTSDLCIDGSTEMAIRSAINSALGLWKRSQPILYHLAVLQLNTGLRISEILSIHSSHISPEGRIFVKGSKGSRSRIVQPPTDLEFWLKEKDLNRYVFKDLNRFHVYREYRNRGISAKFGSNIKFSVTHLPRHLVGLDLKNINNAKEAIAINLGHRGDASADHYTSEIRRKNDP